MSDAVEPATKGLYTKEVKALIEMQRKRCPSRGLIFDVVEYNGQYLTLRLYRENLADFSEPQQVGIFMWVTETMKNVRSVVPCYLEVEESVPRR